MPRIVTYECTQCGTEVVVTADGETNLRPIYCCGIEITEISSADKTARTEKRAVKKPAKKAIRAARSTATINPKKRADTKKKASKGKRTASAKKPAKRG